MLSSQSLPPTRWCQFLPFSYASFSLFHHLSCRQFSFFSSCLYLQDHHLLNWSLVWISLILIQIHLHSSNPFWIFVIQIFLRLMKCLSFFLFSWALHRNSNLSLIFEIWIYHLRFCFFQIFALPHPKKNLSAIFLIFLILPLFLFLNAFENHFQQFRVFYYPFCLCYDHPSNLL